MFIPLLRLNCNKARLLFLVLMIRPDGTWERDLSLALDRVLLALEKAA